MFTSPIRLCVTVGVALSAVATAAQQTSQPVEVAPAQSPAKWLVDLARDYGQGLSRPALADAQVVLALMRAAARLDPNDPEPCQWQSELLDMLHQPQESLAALTQYIDRDPGNVTARLRWMGLEVNALQTVEARQEFIQAQLAKFTAQPLLAADAHRRLAEIAHTRANRTEAEKQIELALKLAPDDVTANRLAYEMNGLPDDRAAQVRAALRMIAANPMQVNLIWQLGELLDGLSLHREAQFWYGYALDVHRAANPGGAVPSENLFQLARSRADGGDLEGAMRDCAEAIRVNPRYVRARLLMVHILRKLNRSEQAAQQVRTIAERYATMASQVRQTRDAQLAAEMAWFYALYDRQPDLAWEFAQIAVSGLNPTPDALRAYGFAALAKNNLPEAERVLKDLAPGDQMAAVGLAKVYLASGKTPQAVAVLKEADKLRSTGTAHDEIVQMLHDNGSSAAPPPDHAKVRRALADFDRAPLEYYKQPSKFLRLTARFLRPQLAPAEPWFVLFEMTNVGPFNITFGEEMMVVPQLLLSAAASGDRDRQFPNYMLVYLDRTPVLAPGQSVGVVQTVDLGPVRRAMTITPQVKQEIVLGGLLDPVRSPDGKWTHRLGGFSLKGAQDGAPPAKATRLAFAATQENVGGLLTALRCEKPDEVLHAAGILTSLLAEYEALRDGVLTYKAAPIDATAITRAMMEAVGRQKMEPVVRARLIQSFRRIGLMDAHIKPLAQYLSDDHWLVRLMTAWLFAHKQGPVFATVARRMAQSDPDGLVRDLAAAYLEKWQRRASSTSSP